MGRILRRSNLLNFKMALTHFLIAFLALGVVAAEEGYIEGLSAEEIMSSEFEVEYSTDDRTIDEIIAAAGTMEGAALSAADNQEVNFDMDMNMDPMMYASEYGNIAGFAGHSHYIEIFSGRGCYSSVGYNHRSHQVSLQARGCTIPGIVAHELGHTIGLHHEQCRPDRDSYLRIMLGSVPSNMRHNFNKVRGTSNLGMPYDYCSLMHYGATAFGGRSFTIVPKDLDYLAVIGRSHVRGADLTYTDSTIVNKMYGCNIQSAPTACNKIPCTSRWSSSTCNSLRG